MRRRGGNDFFRRRGGAGEFFRPPWRPRAAGGESEAQGTADMVDRINTDVVIRDTGGPPPAPGELSHPPPTWPHTAAALTLWHTFAPPTRQYIRDRLAEK